MAYKPSDAGLTETSEAAAAPSAGNVIAFTPSTKAKADLPPEHSADIIGLHPDADEVGNAAKSAKT